MLFLWAFSEEYMPVEWKFHADPPTFSCRFADHFMLIHLGSHPFSGKKNLQKPFFILRFYRFCCFLEKKVLLNREYL